MASNRKIFHLITRLIKGGAVNALLPISTELDGFDVTVGYGREHDIEIVNELHRAGVRTEEFPLIRHYNPITAIGAVVTVARYISKHDFDVVHTHSTEAGIIGRVAARLAGAPSVVHTIHGVPFTVDRNWALNHFVERCEHLVAPQTDVMVAVADTITEEYLSRGIGREGQYETIRYGIEVDEFSNAQPASDLPGSGHRVLMVSRLAEGKGFDVLLDAAQELRSLDLSILIVGDGPKRADIEKKIEQLDLAETVFLLGYRDDVPRVMAASDLLVLPSYREGTPYVIMEAMAAGLPVVATNIAGIPEMIDEGETGFLIPPGNPDALTACIRRIVDDPKLSSSFGEAGARQSDAFSVERMVDEYRSLYNERV